MLLFASLPPSLPVATKIEVGVLPPELALTPKSNAITTAGSKTKRYPKPKLPACLLFHQFLQFSSKSHQRQVSLVEE